MNSILIIRGGALGDFIVTLPACGLLRKEWPQARIEFLGNPTFGELGHRRHYFDGVRSLERGSLARFFVPGAELDPDWSDYFSEFDLIVSYLYDPDDFFHTNLARCTLAQVVRGTPQVQLDPAARHFCEPLKEVEVRTDHFVSQLFPSAEDRAFAQKFLEGCGSRVLAFHPGSGSPGKNWPLDQWSKLLPEAEAQGFCPLLIAGEVELENLTALSPLAKKQAVGLPLPHLAAILERCAVYIGHDSGVTHLAGATGIKTIALFGPTDPQTWAPPGAHITVLKGGVDWVGFRVSEVSKLLSV